MPGGAQLVVAGHVNRTTQRHLLLRVINPETRLHAAIGCPRQAAGGQGIGTATLPVGKIDLRIFIEGGTGRVDQLEQAATFQVGAYRRRNDLRSGGIAGKIGNRHRNPVGAGAGDFD